MAAEGVQKRRRLRRYSSDEQESLTIEAMPCVVGLRLKEPVCLPTKLMEGVRMVRLATKEAWLNQVLSGRVVSSDFANRLRTMKTRILAQAKLGAFDDGAGLADSPGAVLAAKGRQSLLGDAEDSMSDAEREAFEEDMESIAAGHRKQRRALLNRRPKQGSHTVTVRGVAMRVALRHRVLWFECTAEAVNAVVKEVHEETTAPAAARAKERAERNARRLEASGDNAGLEGRVYFDVANGGWVVSFLKEDGTRGTCTKGLKVPMRGPDGALLSPKEYQRAMREKCEAGQLIWNDLDSSDRQPFAM